MNHRSIFLLPAILLGAVFVSGCGGTPLPATQPLQPIQVSTDPSTPTHAFAPACPVDPLCAQPDVKDSEPTDTYCVTKIPYQNFSVEPGSTFEPLEAGSDLSCVDTGAVDKNGKNVWTCTGKELWTYGLKISNPNCQVRTLVPNPEMCQTGQSYDPDHNCCAPQDGSQTGFKNILVNMGACPTP